MFDGNNGSYPGQSSVSRIGVLILMAMLTLMPASAAVRQQPSFVTADEMMRWMNNYRTKPDPWRLPQVIRGMAEMGLFNDQETASAHLHFHSLAQR